MSRKVQKYGWTPDLPDHRDHTFSVRESVASSLPQSVNLQGLMTPCYDQLQLGSCTANSISAAIEYALAKMGLRVEMPSRLFIYWNERNMEGTVGSDSGAQIRDGIKSINTWGACLEKYWPYDITKFTEKAPACCYRDAINRRAVKYASVNQDLASMHGCLASGFPFVFGFSVYSAFESQQVAQTGVLNLPGPSETQVGGHAVLCVGYDNATQRFRVRNSWGTSWGQNGYFTIPYSYLTNNNLADDFWQVDLVTR